MELRCGGNCERGGQSSGNCGLRSCRHSRATEAIDSGAFDFIEKPFEADLLLGLVRSAFDLHRGNSMTKLTKKGVENKVATLSDRERQVSDRIVLGQTNGSVERDLTLAERSVGDPVQIS
jgi:FixJ family two-component response regulator